MYKTSADLYIGENCQNKYVCKRVTCTPEQIDLHHKKNIIRRRIKRMGKTSIIAMNNAKLQLKQLRKKSKALWRRVTIDHQIRNIQNVNNKHYDVHKAVKILQNDRKPISKAKPIPYLIDTDANGIKIRINHPFEKAELFAEKFFHRNCDVKYDIPDDINFKTLPILTDYHYPTSDLKQAEYIPNDDATPQHQIEENARLEREIEPAEIVNSFYKMSTKVNHGPGLEKKLLYYVFDDHIDFLTLYFNVCKENEYFPALHTHGHTGALEKKGRDNHEKDNFRNLP